MDTEVLKDIGLSEQEATIYLTLLRLGSSSVADIAETVRYHRPNIYDTLEKLMDKGLVNYVIKEKTKYYNASKPETLKTLIKEKLEKLDTILPELVNLTKLPREDTFVEVFKGKEVVRTVYRDIIRELEKQKSEVLLSGVEEKRFMEEDRIALIQQLKRLDKMKCRERVLVMEGDTNFVEGKQTIYRWISKKFFNPTPIYVYGNKLTIIIWGNPNYGIIIENRDLADSYRKQFNLLWEISKEVRTDSKD